MKPKIKIYIYENIHSLTLRIIEEAKISINSFINYNTRESDAQQYTVIKRQISNISQICSRDFLYVQLSGRKFILLMTKIIIS